MYTYFLVPYPELTGLPSKGKKRRRETEQPVNIIPTERPPKRFRSLPPGSFVQSVNQEVVSGISTSQRSHISHWVEKKNWPEQYFQEDAMDHLLAKKKSFFLLARKRSQSSLTTSATPSDQRPREEKTAPYRNSSYIVLLETQGNSYINEDKLGISATSERLCKSLLEKKQPFPKDTIFRDDDTFRVTCNKLEGKNEARILKDLTPLLVPSAESLATLGASHLDIVVESVNEGWNNCIPITIPRPQPDYALGFGRSAFSDDQQKKLRPFVGDPSDVSYFMATYYMYFPFLTCEVKCGTAGLDIADRQNAHSMTVAMNGIYQLFKALGREQELHRRVLGFSYSHDHESVRIWCHYAVINADKATFRRHSIRKFYLTELDKWTAYNFTKNVYDTWVTPHFEWICSAIDNIPADQEFGVSAAPGPHVSETSGLSQPLENHNLVASSSVDDLQPITPDTSTQMEKPGSKKKKKMANS